MSIPRTYLSTYPPISTPNTVFAGHMRCTQMSGGSACRQDTTTLQSCLERVEWVRIRREDLHLQQLPLKTHTRCRKQPSCGWSVPTSRHHRHPAAKIMGCNSARVPSDCDLSESRRHRYRQQRRGLRQLTILFTTTVCTACYAPLQQLHVHGRDRRVEARGGDEG
ncbi:hypothetical protein C0Q70_11532 [Pomacea canaliculata]|uniref:Uncharacterized protein n=1 Tax=Pomacea canaliculata TaxID=400727 RepID=A0A2T7P687_POMCA|nr:hypothetical protein C0Q70_11532 [Pomacea canaliculata]